MVVEAVTIGIHVFGAAICDDALDCGDRNLEFNVICPVQRCGSADL